MPRGWGANRRSWDEIQRMRQRARQQQQPATAGLAPVPAAQPLPRTPVAPVAQPAHAGVANPAVPPGVPPEVVTQPWVPPPSSAVPPLPNTGTPTEDFMWPIKEQDYHKLYEQRVASLPAWLEGIGYQAGQDIGGMFGTSPVTPQEQFALQQITDLAMQPTGPSAEESAASSSLMGALGDQPPGGSAFESIMGALTPAWQREMDELYDVYTSDMAAKGLTYSGRYGRGLEGLMDRASESYASTMAPYAMRGEELSQEERMAAAPQLMDYGQQMYQRPQQLAAFTVPSLMNYGAGQYNRMWDPYEELFRLMGGMQGAVVPDQPSPGFWDYATDIGGMFL